MNEYDIIVRPHITEKSSSDVQDGKYTFVVDIKATKIDIKKAIEKIFEVKVISVNTARYDGKKRSRRQAGGMVEGSTAKWKKAIITIDTNPAAAEYVVNGEKKTKKFSRATTGSRANRGLVNRLLTTAMAKMAASIQASHLTLTGMMKNSRN